jgi:TPR repeat protein
MKKLLLAAWVFFSACAQTQAGSLCGEMEARVGLPKGEKLTLDEWRRATKLVKLGPVSSESVIGLILICGVGIDKNVEQGLAIWEQAAQVGDRDALRALFDFHSGTGGFPANAAKAAQWLQVGADSGEPTMQAELGRRYLLGIGVGKDNAMAERWLAKSAASGLAEAYTILGALHLQMNNTAEALRWFRLGVAADQPSAYMSLGAMYSAGIGVPMDREEGLRLSNLGANKSPQTQYAMGLLHMQGLGVPSSPEEAVTWFRRAAEGGYADAQEELAYAYERGVGVTQNLEESKRWRQKAILGGSQLAQQRSEQAVKAAQRQSQWEQEQRARYEALREATKDGSAKSKITLAYYLGRSNSKEVIEWLQKAIDQGSAEAQYKLGIVYWYQQSGTSDPAHGLQLIRRAAALGHADAVVWLARAYHQGTDLPTNLVAAYALHFLALRDQDDVAQRLVAYKPPFDDIMSGNELARARQLVTDMAKPGNFLVALDAATTGL